jgi:RNA polymerase sigma factor (sigma-70 family)
MDVPAALRDEDGAATDNELMVAVRDGDLTQLGALFERYHAELFNFFLRLTGSRQLSDDLVQEAFVRVLKYRRTFRQPGEFRPWFYQLARNAAMAHFRKHRREVPAPAELEERPADSPSPPSEMERDESARLLRAALLHLPYERREVLVLSRFGELRYDQIAGLLGCTTGAVKLRVHRAIKQLREVYDGLTTARRRQ